MNVKLTSDEAQIIVDELNNAIRARKGAQPDYALKMQKVRDKVLLAAIRQPTHKPRKSPIKYHHSPGNLGTDGWRDDPIENK